MNYTTIEQSKKLLELGLSPESADMYIWESESKLYIYVGKLDDINCIPCWSLGALINLLPPSIKTGEGIQNQYEIDIRKYCAENKLYLYQIAYGNSRGPSGEWDAVVNTGERENLVDAAFEVVCWLLENGYIKKGE